ncbi:MAG: DNA-binding protein WhiA [Bacilli bacterium]|nr:DNA-binding protein WhiA [Bacilli bacterium]
MTFTGKLKNEICSLEISRVAMLSELSAMIRYGADIKDDGISFRFENAFVARRVYKNLKSCFNVTCHITVRNQRRFRMKQIYLLELKNATEILSVLHVLDPMKREFFSDPEEMVAFVRGAFLMSGSVNDPSTSGYHLEYVFDLKKEAIFFDSLLHEMKFDSKMTRRSGKWMVYLKNSEDISDMIRMFETPNCLFYFEDIRIYRDHKNMVNRLNNCDIANQEKSTRTGLEQLKVISYLRENHLVDLLDEHSLIVLQYREKYPESSFSELANIITLETGYKIGKSGVNHHFIKMKKLMENHQNKKS